jgi:enediyne biosynthesis protein E4
MIKSYLGLAMLAGIPASFHLIERASDAGLSVSVECGGPEKNWIMEANGAGVAVLDYDRDGFMDLLVVNGSSVNQLAKLLATGSPEPRDNGVHLYRNTRAGHFEDVTAKSKLSNPYWGTGANAADFDNDGYPDVLITTIGRDLLYRNQGNGTFIEISRKAGLDQSIAWHTGSAFGDYDGDGDLDLYITGYVDVRSLGVAREAPVCRYLDLPVFCGPMKLKGESDLFYRNDGNGSFVNVTRAAGLHEPEPRYGFTAVFEDFNQDGKPDIFVANDSTPNYLYLNNGKAGFEEAGLTSGLAFSADGRSQANMGVAVGDVDNDGDLDVLTTTFSEDYFPLFEQAERGVYEEVSARAGLVLATTPLLGWACGFADLDNDGWRDLWVANGHVYPSIAKTGRSTYEQPILIFRNRQGRFRQDPQPIGDRRKQSWRGGASADFNNDGRIDLVLTPISGPPALLENRGGEGNHWIGIDLKGQALGARISVEGCGQKWFDTARNAGSYLSANDPRQHFGLGQCKKLDRVRVLWPSGKEQLVADPAMDRYHTLQ